MKRLICHTLPETLPCQPLLNGVVCNGNFRAPIKSGCFLGEKMSGMYEILTSFFVGIISYSMKSGSLLTNHYNDLAIWQHRNSQPSSRYRKDHLERPKRASRYFFGGGISRSIDTGVFVAIHFGPFGCPQQTTPGMMSCDLILQPKMFLTYRTGPFPKKAMKLFLETHPPHTGPVHPNALVFEPPNISFLTRYFQRIFLNVWESGI